MSLVVESTLGLAQLQDAGRFGVRHLGVTQGGALDWVSARWANWLLGNPPESPVLEVPLGGVTLRCQADTTLALTGADLNACLDGQPLAPWRSFAIARGQQLVFGSPAHGVRAYLAAPGGFQAPSVLGSAATVVREGLGGLQGDGRVLRQGDLLRSGVKGPAPRQLPAAQVPRFGCHLDVVPGAQIAGFAGRSLFEAFNAGWTLDSRADRMGIRLLGPPLAYRGPALISEGIPLGAIQVPPDGQPIVLLNDRQTIGGYPRLGALTPQAVAQLAQAATGTAVHLRPVTQAAARARHLALLAGWR